MSGTDCFLEKLARTTRQAYQRCAGSSTAWRVARPVRAFEVLIVLAAVAISSGVALAQSTAADIVGTVRDPSGAVVPAVVVKAVQAETNFIRETQTNADGIYEFRILPPGTYTLTAEVAGFKKYINEDIPLASRQVLRIEISLVVGSITENVTVVSEVPMVNTETGTLSETRGSRLLTEGPQGTPIMSTFGYNTLRNSVLVRGSGEAGYKAAGSRAGQYELSIDGNAVETTYTNITVPYQAVREEKVTVVGAPAEFRTPVTLDAVTQQGTNRVHGAVTLQYSHDRLNALAAMSPTSARPAQLPRHQWNLTVGGPLYIPKVYDGRNRTFLFFSGERATPTDVRVAFGRLVTVPTNGMRQGEFESYFNATGKGSKSLIDPLSGQPFAGKLIPKSRWNPAAAKAVDLFFPAPNVSGINPDIPLNNFNGPSASKSNWHTLFARIDQVISSRNTFGFSYTESPINNSSSEALPSLGMFVISGHAKQFNWTDTHVVSPTIVNEARVGYFIFDNERWGYDGGTLGGIASTLGIDLGADAAFRNARRQAPTISITGLTGINSTYADDQRVQRWLTMRDNLSIQKGKHSFKLGYDHRFKRDDRLTANNAIGSSQSYTGRHSGDPFADFLLGIPEGTARYTPGVEWLRRRYNELGLYAQDQFKATSRLTLNFGLRFERISPRTETSGAYINFDPSTLAIVFPDAKSIGLVHPAFPAQFKKVTAAQAGFPEHLMNPSVAWIPRFGFAQRLTDRGNMVLRGAYSIFSVDAGWSNNNWRFIDSGPFALSETFVNTITAGVPLVTLNKPFPNLVGRGPSTVSVSGRNPDIGTPLTQQYNLTLERQLIGAWVARLGYVGSRTTQLWYNRDLNRPPASTIPFTTSRLLHPEFQSIGYLDKGGNGWFNGLQAGVTHRFSSGLEFDGLFQWVSELADVGENGTNTTGFALENPYCRSCEKGKITVTDSLDFRANVLYQLPFGRGKRFGTGSGRVLNGLIGGWTLSSIIDARSGRPNTVTFSGRDTSNTNLRSGRADVVPGCNIRPGDGRSGPYLDINCFAIPQNGTFGNASPSVYRDPGSWEVSGAAYKYFPLFREDLKLRINGVFTNLFNHPTWSGVYNNISVPATFGKFTGQGAPGRWTGPRSILLQAQLQW